MTPLLPTSRPSWTRPPSARLARVPGVPADPEHQRDSRARRRLPAGGRASRRRPGAVGLEHVEVAETGGHPIVYADWLHAAGAPDRPALRPLRRPAGRSARGMGGGAFRAVSCATDASSARGASDDKSNITVAVAAAEALLATRGALPVNLRLVFEGEEESSSVHLDAVAHGERRPACRRRRAGGRRGLLRRQPARDHGRAARASAPPRSTSAGPCRTSIPGSYGGRHREPDQCPCDDHRGAQGPRRPDPRSPASTTTWSPLSAADRDGARRASVRRGGLPRRARRPGACRRDGLDDAGATGRPPDVRRERDLGRLLGRGQQDDHPRPRARQGHLPTGREPGPGPRLRRSCADYVLAIAPPGVRVEVVSLGGGRPTLTPTDHPATRAYARALEATFGRAPLYIREGGSVPVAASFETIVGLPVTVHGLHAAERQLPRPQRVDGPGQPRRRDPGARPLLRRVRGRPRLTGAPGGPGWYSGRVSGARTGARIRVRGPAPPSATPGERVHA